MSTPTAAVPPSASPPLTTLSPRKSLAARLRELLRYRTLIYNLVVRELKARYKNSALGFLWSLLNPLGMMLVFLFVFSVVFPAEIENYPIFLLTGLLPWNFFQASVLGGTNSIVGNAHLLKKVYFPREVLPIAAVLAQLVNFLLAFVVLFAALIFFPQSISPWVWLLPLVILIQTVFSIGIVFILSTVNVFYRDTMIIIDVVMLAWFFLTPIFYEAGDVNSATVEGEMNAAFNQPITVLGQTFLPSRLLFIVNPVASIVNMYRDLLYAGTRTQFDFFLRTSLTALVVFGVGYWFFNRYSGRFGEEV